VRDLKVEFKPLDEPPSHILRYMSRAPNELADCRRSRYFLMIEVLFGPERKESGLGPQERELRTWERFASAVHLVIGRA
jgi:hypothetical protein